MNSISNWTQILGTSFYSFFQTISTYLPKIIGALIVFIIGRLIAKVIKKLVLKFLERDNVKFLLKKDSVRDIFKTFGIKKEIPLKVSNLIGWLIFTIFGAASIEILGLKVLSNISNDFINFIPKLISALVIFIFTLFVGKNVGKIVTSFLDTVNFSYKNYIGYFVQALITFFGLIIAFEKVGFDTKILLLFFGIIISAFCFAVSLSFALASKSSLKNLIGGYYVKKNLKMGDIVFLKGKKAEILELNNINIKVKFSDDVTSVVPYSKVVKEGF